MPRVIAVALDGTELTLIQALAASGRLPCLGDLLKRGRLTDIESAMWAGSGAVWPSFSTETSPNVHGRYAEWLWDPKAMNVARTSSAGREPFWFRLAEDGITTMTVDVPYTPLGSRPNLHQAHEWGPHDLEFGSLQVDSEALRAAIAEVPRHPFADYPVAIGPDDASSVRAVAQASYKGVALRGDLIMRALDRIEPDLAILVFSELHHAGHDLWHTWAPDDPLFEPARYQPTKSVKPDLADIYEAADHQLARIVQSAGSETTIMIFSLHGMRAGPGVVTILPRLLEHDGYSTRATWKTIDGAARRAEVVRTMKRAAPRSLRKVYQRRVDYLTRARMASRSLFDPRDWAHTRAFNPSIEGLGYARLNLQGRESGGIVAGSDYEELRKELEGRIRAIADIEGRPLVDDVILPSVEPSALPLPDVIVHWARDAHMDGIRLAQPAWESPKVGIGRTGEHSRTAFCLTIGPGRDSMPDSIDAPELATYIRKFCDTA